MNKPRVRFCWECGRKLYGNHFKELILSDGLPRILHKQCAKTIENNRGFTVQLVPRMKREWHD